jgi:putative hydrolase of the HAD superfamily
MQHIKAIYFDLDDTLWDMEFVIPRAEQRLYDWFADQYPRVTDVYTPAQLHRLRHRIGVRHPELRHDLSSLRMKMLREIFTKAGYDDAPAQQAFEVFQQARNQVRIYDDVVPALQRLAQTHRLFALTNGNASLQAIGISELFEACVTACELGVAKPDTEFFARALRATGLTAGEVLHVGDHPQNDIQAASKANMATVWLNRKSVAWPLPECSPDHELSNLAPLADMLQS